MKAAIQQGPIRGSAPFVSARRPIGIGPRAILVTNPASKATPRTARAKPAPRRAARRTSLWAGFLGSLLFSAAAFGLSYAVDVPRTLMSRSDYLVAREAIAADVRAQAGLCRAEPPAARDVCRAQAHASESVRRAELDARYHGTVAAAAEVQRVAVKARFEVSRARCNALDSAQRPQCLHSARAAGEVRALAAPQPAT